MEIVQQETEADVGAELYYQLRQRGITPRMEIKVPCLITKSGKIRVDLAIVKHGELLAVIEVKRTRKVRKLKTAAAIARDWAGILQNRAYESFERNTGIPVIWCRGRRDIPEVIACVMALAALPQK